MAAIHEHCVKEKDGKKMFAWSVDLKGNWDIYDEPPGSLLLLPHYGFCSQDDEIWRHTTDVIRRKDYPYSFADCPIAEIGCPHAPHPWVLSIANSLLSGKQEEAGKHLALCKLDNGIACESVDEYWIKQRDEGRLVALPGNYILLENSYQQELLMLDDIMFDIQLKGYRPILAHPERYPYYAMRHDRYRTLHNAGVKFQVNLLSLAGYYGVGPQQTAEWLIDNDFCDFLGSDMHGERHAVVIEDYITTKEWRKIAKKLDGRLLNDRI